MTCTSCGNFRSLRPGRPGRAVHSGRAAGFTMIELIVVIVVIAAISVTARPLFSSINAAREADWRGRLDATLRQARDRAYASRRLVCASLNASQISLQIASSYGASSCSTAVNLGESNSSSVAYTLPAGFSTLYFQPRGTITLDAAGATPATGSITFSDSAPIVVIGALGLLR